MAAPGLGSEPTVFEGRRPAPITPPPAGGEIKKLRERLLKHAGRSAAGLTDQACAFLASAVTSPGAVRQQLSRPNIRPTATGHLEVIYATVPIDCLAPDPTNGRVVGATAWPASDLDEGQTLKLWAPADMRVHRDSPCEIMLTSDSLATIKTVIEEAAEHTKKLNPAMKAKVQYDGILDPLLCQIAHIETFDGHRGIALLTRDGSTRCSFAKQAHGSDAHEAFFGAVRDVDVRRQRWLEMRRRAGQPLDAISSEDLVQLRTFLVDVQIVVAFHSDDPGVSALDAVDDIVRRTHVEPTHPWLPVAQDNSEADQMLAALRNRDVISQDQFLLYGGALARSQRAARKLAVEADCVLAELMKSLGAGETRRGVLDELHTTMRAVRGRGQIRNKYKAGLVGSLGLRQFGVDARSRETAHLTLGEALSLDALWDVAWKNTMRTAEQLRDAALAELARDSAPGPACRELAVKSAGHLAAHGWLKRESRDQPSGFRDQRTADTVLDLMHHSPHGVRALAEALAAGRRGAEARAVREDGEVVERAAGDVHPMTNQWLRQKFADADASDSPASRSPLPAATGATTPREHVRAGIRSVGARIGDLERALDEAQRVTDTDGQPFLACHGWSSGEIEPLAGRLQRIAATLSRYGVIADVNPGLPPVAQLDLDLAAGPQAA
jgi:hypothetical protein